MRIYLDDNVADRTLAALLARAGHTVVRPADAGQTGVTDTEHLEYAIRETLAVLTRDRRDFRNLHQLLQAAGGTHHGIILIRYDNDPTRDMKPRHIVSAIRKLEQSGLDLTGQLIILNQWR